MASLFPGLFGGTVSTLSGGAGRMPITSMTGSIYGGALQLDAINNALDERGGNIRGHHHQIRENSKNFLNGVQNYKGETHVKGVFEVNEDFAKNMSGATRDYTRGTAGAINSGAAIQRGGIIRGAEMESEAAGIRSKAQINAAETTLRAGLEAANLRATQFVLSHVASKVARDIEKGIEMRF